MIFILRSFRFKFGSSGSKSFKGRNGTGCIKSQKTVSAATTAPQNVPCRPLIMWAANMKSTRTSAWSAACAPGCVIPPPSSTRRTMPTPLPTTWWSSRPTWWCAAPAAAWWPPSGLPWRGKRWWSWRNPAVWAATPITPTPISRSIPSGTRRPACPTAGNRLSSTTRR